MSPAVVSSRQLHDILLPVPRNLKKLPEYDEQSQQTVRRFGALILVASPALEGAPQHLLASAICSCKTKKNEVHAKFRCF